jgi:hypothetical protein
MDKPEGPSAHFFFCRLLKGGFQFVPSGNFSFPEKLPGSKRTNAENPKTHLWISGTL